MRTIDYNLPASQGGGKLVNFQYSRSLNELIGSWTAEVAGGSFAAGADFSVTGMQNGVIASAIKDADGLWHLTGKDAGVRLMRTTPHVSTLAGGGAAAVIADLADYCGVQCSITGGLTGFNVRSAVTGTTCAEAILELAMLSGLVARISNTGWLIVTAPVDTTPTLTTIIDDSGSQLDLDGYATQATVVITRRKQSIKEEFPPGTTTVYYRGSTPGGSTTDETKSGSFSFTDVSGKAVSGSYSITRIQPLGVLKKSVRTITRDGVTVRVEENHTYDIRTKTVWRGDQEFRLLAYSETGYTTEQKATGSYSQAGTTFTETTTETMSRTFSIYDAMWVPIDWKGTLDMVARENYIRQTTRTGGVAPLTGMPEYAPQFDSKISREFTRADFGLGLICSEIELTTEMRDIGETSAVALNGVLVNFTDGSYLAIPAHTTPKWVVTETLRTYYEKYRNDGTCEISTKTEWCDDGAKWLLALGLPSSGDPIMDERAKSYAKFSQRTKAMEIGLNDSNISSSIWQFLELPGRTRVFKETNDGTGLSAQDWYWNGGYLPSRFCPHYDRQTQKCRVTGVSAIGDFTGDICPYSGLSWQTCVRAEAALEQARSEDDRPLLEAPVVGTASIGNSYVGYQREIYIDDIISDGAAQSIASTIAANILAVKGTKGYRKTVVIPYDSSFIPNGNVTDVSHDWGNMQTTLSYRTAGSIPSFLIPASVGGIAAGISDRDAGRRTRPMAGTITAIQSDGVMVNIGGVTYPCSTRFVNLGVGDSVLVSFASGNSVRGQIIERL